MTETVSSLTLSGRVEAVLARVRQAEIAAGRLPGSVRVIGASKTRTAVEVQTAFEAGIRDFGENYAQELLAKAGAVPQATWHFIGHLQRNKAPAIVASAGWFHALDTVRLGDHLERLLSESGRRLASLIEVNVGGEASKAGLAPEGIVALAEHVVARCPHLDLVGLMTIPPPTGEPARWFDGLREMRDVLQTRLGRALPELSMGMSDDFEMAIASGATMVRVGTALFGERSVRHAGVDHP